MEAVDAPVIDDVSYDALNLGIISFSTALEACNLNLETIRKDYLIQTTKGTSDE